jgi:hypothetical protein
MTAQLKTLTIKNKAPNVLWCRLPSRLWCALAVCALSCVFFVGGCALTNEILHNRYIGDKETMIYHKERCEQVKKIDPRQVAAFPYNSAARYEGYKPCDKCNPDK